MQIPFARILPILLFVLVFARPDEGDCPLPARPQSGQLEHAQNPAEQGAWDRQKKGRANANARN
jgi:hypothetical protein